MKINYYIQKNEKYLKNIYNKRLDKTEELNEKIDNNSLVFTIISTGRKTNFSKKMILQPFFKKLKKVK